MPTSLPKVTSYLKNVGKSVAFLSVKQIENMTPGISGFLEDNEEIFKTTIEKASDMPKTIREVQNYIKNSAVGKAVDDAKKNTIESLKTGEFYSKKREAASFEDYGEDMDEDLFGGDLDFDFGDSDSDDDDFESNSSESDSSDSEIDIANTNRTIDAIDRSTISISNYVSESVGEAAKAQANVTVQSSNYVASVVSGMSQVQIAKLDSLLEATKTGFNGVYNELHKVSNNVQVITQAMDNSSKYYEESLKIFQESNAMLKEMLEMQRNLYQAQSSNYKESEYDKIVSFEGYPDLKAYGKRIMKNISDASPIDAGLGVDMLKNLAANPVAEVLNIALEDIAPKYFKDSIKQFDKLFSSAFSNMMNKVNETAEGYSSWSWLANFLKIPTEEKKSVNTGNFKKDAVPFDGITRQSIVEVIPSYLRRIEAALTRQPERYYDNNSGMWKGANDLRKEFKSQTTRGVAMSTWDLSSAIDEYFRSDEGKQKYGQKITKKQYNESMNKLREKVYEDNGNIQSDNAAHYGIDQDIFDAFMYAINNTKEGRNARMGLAKEVQSAKQDQTRTLESIENDPSNILRVFYNGEVSTNGTNDKERTKLYKDFSTSNPLREYTDLHGKSVFDYLRSIDLKLDNGNGGNTNGRRYAVPGRNNSGTSPTTAVTTGNTNGEKKEDEDAFMVSDLELQDIEIRREKEKEEKEREKQMAPYKGLFDKVKDAKDRFLKRDNKFFDVFDLPFKAATGLIETSNRAIYKFLFGDEYEQTKDEMERTPGGLFGKITKGIEDTFTKITESIDKFIHDPMGFLKDAVGKRVKTIKHLFNPVGEEVKGKLKAGVNVAKNDVSEMTWDAADAVYRSGLTAAESAGVNTDDIKHSKPVETVRDGIAAVQLGIEQARMDAQDEGEAGSGRIGISGGRSRKSKNRRRQKKKVAAKKKAEEEKKIEDAKANEEKPKKEKTEEEKKAEEIGKAIKNVIDQAADVLVGDEKEEKNEKKKASTIVGKAIKDITKDDKGIPSVLASGLIGGGTSLIFGLVGGPLVGFAVGAGIDVARRSKTVQNLLFGNEETGKKGVIPKKVTDFFKDNGVSMRRGAIAGALSAFYLPYGLVGGAAIGAGVGLLTTTNKFKDAIFGEEDNKGERHGGFVGAIQENIINPMAQGIKDIVGGAKDYFKDNILDPLKDFLNPVTQSMKNIGHSIKRTLMDGIKRTVGIPLQYTADRITSLVNNTVGRVAKGAIKKAGQALSIGPKALGKVGNRIRASQIKRGTAHDMSAEERIRFMDEHPELFKGTNSGLGKANKHMRNIQADIQIAGYTDEELDELLQQTSSLYNYNDTRAEDAKKQVNGDLYKYMKDNGILDKTGGGYYTKLAKAIADGNADKVEMILNDDKGLFDRGAKLTEEEANNIRNLAMSGVKNIADLNNNIQTEDEAMNMAFQQLQEQFPNITNRKQLDEFNRKLEGERKARKKGKAGNTTAAADLLDENADETVASKAAETVENAIHQSADDLISQLKTTNAFLEYIAKLNAGEYSDFNSTGKGTFSTMNMELGHDTRQTKIAKNFESAAETWGKWDTEYEARNIRTKNDMQQSFDFDFKGVDFGRMDKKVAYKVMKLKKGKYNEEAIKYLCSLDIKEFNKIYDKLKSIEGIVDFQITDNEILELGELTDKQINILLELYKGKFKIKSLEDIQTILNSQITTPQIARTTIMRAKNAGGVPDSAEELVKFATAYMFDNKNAKFVSKNIVGGFEGAVDSAKKDIAIDAMKKEAESRPEVPELVLEHGKQYQKPEETYVPTLTFGDFSVSPEYGEEESTDTETEELSGGARRRRRKKKKHTKTARYSAHGHKVTYIDGEPADDRESKKGLADDKTTEENDKTNAEVNKGILETTKDTFQRLFGDINENKEKIKNKSSGVLSLIGEKVNSVGKGFKKILTFLGIAGAVFVASKSGLLTALGDFVKEKVWPPIKSFFTDTVGPWVTDTVLPWFTNTAIPALITGLITALPSVITSAIKAVFGIGDSVSETLDNSTIGSSAATSTTYTDSSGNTTSGSTTTSNSSTQRSITETIFGSRTSNEINYLTDENGNLIKGYIDDEGNVIEDENGSYIPVNNSYKTKSTSDNLLGRATRAAGTAFTQGLTGTYQSANLISKGASSVSKVLSKFGIGGKVAGKVVQGIGAAGDTVINAAGNLGSSITGASNTLKNSSVYNGVRDAKAAVELGAESVSNAFNSVKNKIFGEAAEETAETAAKAATEAAEAAESSGIISTIKTNISKVVNKLFENNSFLNKVEQVAQWCGKSVDSTKLGKAILEWADNMVDKAGESGIKKAAASSGKAILTTIGELPIIDIVVGVVNFVSGWNNAGTIFSIAKDDVTPLYRLIAGLLKTLEIVPYLGIVISLVGQSTIIDIFCSTVAPIFGCTDLLEKRENAQNVLDEWNAEHPEETYDNLEDYNHRNDIIYKTKKKVTSAASNALTSIKNFIFGKKTNDDSEEEEAISTAETEAEETTGGKRFYGSLYSGGARSLSTISTNVSNTNDSSTVANNVSTAVNSIITAAKEGDLETIESISNQYSGSSSTTDNMTNIIISSITPMMTMNAVFNKVLGSISSGMNSFISGISSVTSEVNANVGEAMSDIESGKATIFSKSTWTIGDYSNLGGIASVIAPMADLMQRISMTPVYTVKSIISTVLNSIGSIANLFTGTDSTSTSASDSSGTISSNLSSTTSSTTTSSSSSGGILSKAVNTVKKLASLFTGGNRTGLSGGSGEGDHIYQEANGLRNMTYGDSTIGEKGCGPVAATNLLNSMGADANVADAANYAEANGFANGAGTDMGYFGSYLGSKGIPTRNTFSPTEAEDALRSGNKLVLLGDDGAGRNNGVYGKYSHFVTATGMDAKGRVRIEDPDLPQKNKYYNKNEVFNNMRGSVIVGSKRNNRRLGKWFSGGSGSTAVDTVISTARAEVGTKESPSGSNKVKYNTEYYGSAVSGSAYPWCCAFIWWVFKHAGYSKLFYGGNKTASCQTAYDYYKSKGQTVSNPRKGDLIFYKYNGVSRANHIGLISSVGNDGSITTIEGNTGGNEVNGGAVLERTRTISTSNIYGYARPDYTSAGDSEVSDTNTTDTEVSDSTDTTASVTSTESTSSSLLNRNYDYTSDSSSSSANENDIANLSSESKYKDSAYKKLFGGKRNGFSGKAKMGPDGMAYGNGAHFITANGIDEDGNVYVEDPDLPGEVYAYPKEEVFNNMRGSVIVGSKRNNRRLGKYFTGGANDANGSGSSSSSSSYTGGELVCIKAKELGDYMVKYNQSHKTTSKSSNSKKAWHYRHKSSAGFGYTESAPKSFQASYKGNHASNCAYFASWALQCAGYLPVGTTVCHKNKKEPSGASTAKKYGCTLHYVNAKVGTLYKNDKIHPGDVLSIKTSGSGTMCVYAGWDTRNNRPMFYEGGGPFYGRNCRKKSAGLARNDYTSIGPMYIPYDANNVVYWIIRPSGTGNGCVDLSSYTGASSMSGIKGNGKVCSAKSYSDALNNSTTGTATSSTSTSGDSDSTSSDSATSSDGTETIFTKLSNVGTDLMKAIYGEDTYNALFGETTDTSSTDSTSSDSSDSSSSIDTSDVSDVHYYTDGSEVMSNGKRTGKVTGGLKKNQKIIWDYLQQLGYSKRVAAGIMGNIFQESTYKPFKQQSMSDTNSLEYTNKIAKGNVSRDTFAGTKSAPTSKGGYGLSQWTWYTRKQNLYDRTVKKGKRIDDTYNQLDFLKNELDNGYSKVRTAFNNADKASSDKEGVKLAAKGFLQHFEAPANWSGEIDNRNTYALNAWQEMTGSAASKRNNRLSATKANHKLGKGYSGGAGTTTSSSSLLNNSVSKLKSALSSSGSTDNEKLQEAMVIVVEVLSNISSNTANTTEYLSQIAEILSTTNFGSSSTMTEAEASSKQQAAASLKKLMADRSNQGYGALQNSDTSYLVEAMTRIARE